MHTPFFPPWRARLGPMRLATQNLRSKPLPHLRHLFHGWVGTPLLSQEKQGLNSRDRIYSVELTFWTFLTQVLNPGSSCREMVRQVLGCFSLKNQTQVDPDTGAYCTARKRLPRSRLDQILGCFNQGPRSPGASHALWRGHPLKVVDGSTCTMPDTPANQKVFPQQKGQKPGCGFPIMKFVGLFSLSTGCLLSVVTGNFYQSELSLFRRLWHFLKPGDILIADRGFADYGGLAALVNRGVQCVVRLHQGRKADFGRGQYLGDGDRLITWTKPLSRPRTIAQGLWKTIPGQLTLRMIGVAVSAKGFRTRHLIIITTLLDPKKYPAQEIAKLYQRRWEVELFFRDIKTTLQLEHLSCKSPNMIQKEFLMHLIAYNLIRCVMLEGARTGTVDLTRLSFKGAIDAIRQFSDLIALTSNLKKRRRLYRDFLRSIAQDLVPKRPNRREPRAVKRRPKPFPRLNRPRHLYKDTPHPSTYKKIKPLKNTSLN